MRSNRSAPARAIQQVRSDSRSPKSPVHIEVVGEELVNEEVVGRGVLDEGVGRRKRVLDEEVVDEELVDEGGCVGGQGWLI